VQIRGAAPARSQSRPGLAAPGGQAAAPAKPPGQRVFNAFQRPFRGGTMLLTNLTRSIPPSPF